VKGFVAAAAAALVLLLLVFFALRGTLPASEPAGEADPLAHLRAGETVFATFISGSMAPFLENWAAHARAARLSPLICAALDEKAAEKAAALGLRVVMLTTLAQSAVGDGYVNIHKAAFKQMGALKVNFVRRLLARGVHLALTDADALWLGDPRPYFASRGLQRADVLISSDCIDQAADAASHGGSMCNSVTNFNTGVLLIRATPGGVAFADAWQEKLAWGVANNVSWMRDQPAFNLVARERWLDSHAVFANATLADRAATAAGEGVCPWRPHSPPHAPQSRRAPSSPSARACRRCWARCRPRCSAAGTRSSSRGCGRGRCPCTQPSSSETTPPSPTASACGCASSASGPTRRRTSRAASWRWPTPRSRRRRRCPTTTWPHSGFCLACSLTPTPCGGGA